MEKGAVRTGHRPIARWADNQNPRADLSAGNTHDVVMAPALVEAAGIIARLLADKAYDTNPFRAILAERHIEPVIPSIRRRKPLVGALLGTVRVA